VTFHQPVLPQAAAERYEFAVQEARKWLEANLEVNGEAK
jgi:hypothetical protein